MKLWGKNRQQFTAIYRVYALSIFPYLTARIIIGKTSLQYVCVLRLHVKTKKSSCIDYSIREKLKWKSEPTYIRFTIVDPHLHFIDPQFLVLLTSTISLKSNIKFLTYYQQREVYLIFYPNNYQNIWRSQFW